MNSTQIGTAAQLEFVKLLILGSDGKIEASWPVTDDERRDLETHIHGEFGKGLAFQVKATTRLDPRWEARRLVISFRVARGRVVDHPFFWYCLGYLDLKAMVFADPLFIVPSAQVHAHAGPHLAGSVWRFTFDGSMESSSRDQWRQYRVAPRDGGKRVLQILRGRPRKLTAPTPRSAARLSRLPDLLWVRRN